MHRLASTLFGIGLCLLVCVQAGAEKICVVLSRSLPPYEEALAGFMTHIHGEIQKYNMEGNPERGRQIMQEVSAQNAQLVVTIGSEATTAAQKGLHQIPVIYTMVLEKQDFANQISSGVLMQMDIRGQLKRIREIFPQARKIGVVYNSQYSADSISQARVASREYNFLLMPIAVANSSEIPAALQKLSGDKIDVLWSVVDQTTAQPQAVKLLIQHALEQKLPFIGLSKFHVQAGALLAFSIYYQDLGAQTAKLARETLNRHQTLPVEHPRQLVLYLNTQTQDQIGLKEIPSLRGIQIVKEP